MAAPTELEACMETMIKVFKRYAERGSDENNLTKKELHNLLKHELPCFLATQKDPKIVDNIMSDMDGDKDDKMNFSEFVGFVAGLSAVCERLHRKQKH
ncbi:protein S100-A1-like [Genypterus blacodes]|uniref:protein S100-A1-like n=1 Tax=Genypterus blacodes TaxID=154954 RepID=UPI003F76DE9E